MAKNLESIELKIKALQNEKKLLLKKENELKRKARTKRLIERGALLEKYFDFDDNFSNDEVEQVFKKLVSSDNFMQYLEVEKRSAKTTHSVSSAINTEIKTP